jgi:hypothetical protein
MVTELRAAQETSLARLPVADAQAWPLEGVTRLHHQLREADGTAAPARPLPTPGSAAGAPAIAGLLPEAASALKERIESLERALSERESTVAATSARSSRSGRLAIAGLAGVAMIAATLLVLGRDIREATERAERAEQAQQAASVEAARQVDAARQEFTRAAADAELRAARVQTMTEVLAASDLVRFNLFGRRALTGLTALLTWSPTRGMVFSGSQLPPPPAGSTYQLWLLTRGGAVSGGTFSPEPTGTATIAAPRPQAVAANVTGAMVTLESVGGRTAPIGEIVLARPVAVAPVAPDAPDAISTP